jgi:tRNA threonylcarbamoyladenosine biosynthesis protein TsaB
MRILALDTATENCSVALQIGEQVSSTAQTTPRDHANLVLGMVDRLLSAAGVRLQDLDAIAFGRGPGSFTGVRLAAAVTQGLAYAAGRPVLPVSNLRALAHRALAENPTAALVLACADARMGEVYCAGYQRDAKGRLVDARMPEAVLAPEVLMADPAGAWRKADHVVAAGSGFAAYPALAHWTAQRDWPLAGTWLPQARDILALAAADWRLGLAVDPALALPVYLRDKVVTRP